MNDTLRGLAMQRRPRYFKEPKDEEFLLSINELLGAHEAKSYRDYPEEWPIIFVFGLPRSGTTLLTQLVAHSFDVGFINNFMARFWLAPVTGIRLSRILLQDRKETDFRSDYASTGYLTDIHEFGYFWRYWLKKEKLSDFVHVRAREQQIDWVGLKRVLLNIQYESGRSMVFKNIFGSYHIERFVQLLRRLLFVYIERDPLDNAMSILEARKKFYTDLNLWWSSCPVEYEQLKDLPYMEQIGGQVYYLRRLYDQQIAKVNGQHVVRVEYQQVCENPLGVLHAIQDGCQHFCDFDLPIIAEPPSRFEYRRYLDDRELRNQFERILGQFAGRELEA